MKKTKGAVPGALRKECLCFAAALLGLLGILSSIAVTRIVSSALIREGFEKYAAASHLGVESRDYPAYAQGIADCLDGRTDTVLVNGRNVLNDRENAHMRDVTALVAGLKTLRYVGGGALLAACGYIYFFSREHKETLLRMLWRNLARAGAAILLIALCGCVWSLIDFESLFTLFHRLLFSNRLWLMDPGTDKLVALMPEAFFSWYAGRIFESLLPILGAAVCLIVSYLRFGRKE